MKEIERLFSYCRLNGKIIIILKKKSKANSNDSKASQKTASQMTSRRHENSQPPLFHV